MNTKIKERQPLKSRSLFHTKTKKCIGNKQKERKRPADRSVVTDTVTNTFPKRWKDEAVLLELKISEDTPNLSIWRTLRSLQTPKNTALDECKRHKPLLYIKSKPSTFFQSQKSISLLRGKRKIQVFGLAGFLQHQISN